MHNNFMLPISVEDFAAYLDGNLSQEDMEKVESIISSDNSIQEIASNCQLVDDAIINSEPIELILPYELSSLYFELPIIEDNYLDNDSLGNQEMFDDNMDGGIKELEHTLFHHPMIERELNSHLYNKDSLNINLNHTHMNEKNNDIQGAIAAKSLFGESCEGEWSPMVVQGNEGICAIRSQQIILRDYGIDVSIDELKQYAINNGWYDSGENGGTPLGYIGCLLESCNVHCRQDSGCTVYDLVNELSQGHRVIVAVDANELWADRENDTWKQTKEWFTDVFKGETPNHALVVAGVEVNPNDPEDVKVILTDPGTGDLRIEYELDDFMDAWEDSNCFMTTTTEPAPLQYDSINNREIPSNFAMEKFIDANSLPLNAHNLILPGEMAAMSVGAHYSEGHLDIIPVDGKDVDFEEYTQAIAKSQQYKSVIGGGSHLPGQDVFNKQEFVSSLKHLLGISEAGHNLNPNIDPDDDLDPTPDDTPDFIPEEEAPVQEEENNDDNEDMSQDNLYF